MRGKSSFWDFLLGKGFTSGTGGAERGGGLDCGIFCFVVLSRRSMVGGGGYQDEVGGVEEKKQKSV